MWAHSTGTEAGPSYYAFFVQNTRVYFWIFGYLQFFPVIFLFFLHLKNNNNNTTFWLWLLSQMKLCWKSLIHNQNIIWEETLRSVFLYNYTKLVFELCFCLNFQYVEDQNFCKNRIKVTKNEIKTQNIIPQSLVLDSIDIFLLFQDATQVSKCFHLLYWYLHVFQKGSSQKPTLQMSQA